MAKSKFNQKNRKPKPKGKVAAKRVQAKKKLKAASVKKKVSKKKTAKPFAPHKRKAKPALVIVGVTDIDGTTSTLPVGADKISPEMENTFDNFDSGDSESIMDASPSDGDEELVEDDDNDMDEEGYF